MRHYLAASIIIALASGAAAQEPTAKATFVNMSGEKNGTATLTQTSKGVLIDIEVSGLPAGEWIAFHVHETGTCDHETDHESAGGHFNPTGSEHGYLSKNGPHAGDMPNQLVGSDGILKAQVFNSMVTLDENNAIRGKALMIHGGQDDYKTQPSGDAGNRQSCAVIE
jgi:Cu-Zn family superoxide dismutase